MAGNLIDLRKRVRSVKNTQKITKAMKTVSAAKLRKSSTELNKNRLVMGMIEEFLKIINKEVRQQDFPFFQKRETGDSLIVVISADKGLCGAFNSHIIRKAEEYFLEKRKNGENPAFCVVGNKAFRYLKKRDYPIKKSFIALISNLEYEGVQEFSGYLQDIYLQENIREIEFVYTEFLSASHQKPSIKKVFPLSRQWISENADEKVEYIFEPNPEKLMDLLLPRFLDSLLCGLLRESEASEQAARMIAMDLATRNASDMIRSLTLTMNKVRQASITKELLEIITATEALKK